MTATEAEALAQKYDDDVVDMDALQMRFAMEMYTFAGDEGLTDDELEAAWLEMDSMLAIHTTIGLWLDGTLESAWFPERDELGFRISELGREVAQHAFPGVNFDDLHDETCPTCNAMGA